MKFQSFKFPNGHLYNLAKAAAFSLVFVAVGCSAPVDSQTTSVPSSNQLNGPFTLSSSDPMNNSSTNIYMMSNVNNVDVASEIKAQQANNNSVNALVGAISVPSTGITYQNDAIAGIADTYSNGISGTYNNTVALYGQCTAKAAGGECFGGNTLAADIPGVGETFLQSFEADLNINNAADITNGAVLAAGAWSVVPTTSPNGFEIAKPDGAGGSLGSQCSACFWNAGLYTGQGAVTHVLQAAPLSSTPGANSPDVQFGATNSSGNAIFGSYYVDSGGDWVFNPASGASLVVKGNGYDTGSLTAASFFGAGTGLNGLAPGLSIGGNAATASHLAAAPIVCSAGQAPQGILANGNATGCFTPGGGSVTYPGTGIPKSTGNAWGTSYSTTGGGSVVLSSSPSLTGTVGVGTAQNLTSSSTNSAVAGTVVVAATSGDTISGLYRLYFAGPGRVQDMMLSVSGSQYDLSDNVVSVLSNFAYGGNSGVVMSSPTIMLNSSNSSPQLQVTLSNLNGGTYFSVEYMGDPAGGTITLLPDVAINTTSAGIMHGFQMDPAGDEALLTGTLNANDGIGPSATAPGVLWTTGATAPGGSCTSGSLYTNQSGTSTGTNNLYVCSAGAWLAVR